MRQKPRLLLPRLLAAVATIAVVLPVGTFVASAAQPTPGWQAAKDSALQAFTPPPAAVVSLTPGSPGPGYATYSVQATVSVGPGDLGNRVPDTHTATVAPGPAGVLSIPAVSPSNQASGGPPPAGE